MEKIILVCRKRGDHGHAISLIEEMFPECTIEVVEKPVVETDPMISPLENMGASFQLAPFRRT
jgi:hypothetical protein